MNPVIRFSKTILFKAVLCIGLTACSSPQSELEWVEENGFRWGELSPEVSGQVGFNRLSSSQTNVRFRNDVDENSIAENRYYLNGSGVAVADIDGDGLVDIYFARLNGPNKLYKNRGGYRFEDITDRAGVAHEGVHSTGVAFADITGNGLPDLLITSLTENNALYINEGNGRFTLKEDSGLGESRGAKTMAVADINGNGYLDLYIANYKRKAVTDIYPKEELTMENTVSVTRDGIAVRPPFDRYYTIIESEGRPIRVETGESDQLFLNRGDGRFEEADPSRYFLDEDGRPMGLSADWGLTATFRDVNGNGYPDLYVANDFWTPDRFWMNRGDGTFRAIESNAIRSQSFSSMGVDFSDINRDGHLDIVVTEMLSQEHQRRMRQASQNIESSAGRTLNNRNSVYLNRGDSTFAQIAHYSGLEATEWSWATAFMDVNLNGVEDLIVATGYSYDYLDMDTQFFLNERSSGMSQQTIDILEYPSLEVNNKIFRNNGNLTFTDHSREWGFVVEDVSMGMAMADLNGDGDLDLILNRLNDEAAIYENRIDEPRIAVRLKGESPNTKGIGAKVLLRAGRQLPDQQKEITAGGNYLSGSQAQVAFAANPDSSDHELIIHWPSGGTSRINHVRANRLYEIDEGGEQIAGEPEYPAVADEEEEGIPLFEDLSHRLNHVHHENDFNDFQSYPLLPQKLSRLGPGVAWVDVTSDGREELLMGSGKDGRFAMYTLDDELRFSRMEAEGFNHPVPADQTALAGWREESSTRLVVGYSPYELTDEENGEIAAVIYELGSGGKVLNRQIIPGDGSSTGPLAVADVNGNGWLDLFVGGRFAPGQYPRDTSSRLFRNENGHFVPDKAANQLFTELGLVTGAVFSDLTDNGWPDLLVSTEWGTLRLFENSSGVFQEVTGETGLDRWHGWWQGVSTGDFNGNGRPDIVASNLGLNSPYQIKGGHELRLYYEDINWDGQLNIIDSYYDRESGGYVPRKRLYEFGSIPTILNQVRTHREFATSTVGRIFDRDFDEIPYKRINTLEHMIFINEAEGFEGHSLPAEAQFSAGFHAGVADVDNDGKEDLFLSQNFFDFPKTISRQDAGRGLILKGDGEGGFTPMSGSQSGIKIYGEQRGAAFNDINENGRPDLVVTQNNGETRLYINRSEQAGVRVRLQGPPANRNAIGSSVRLVYENGKLGPKREIRTGAGYWSQDSSRQVLGWDSEPKSIEVRWFDGRTDLVDVRTPLEGREYVIRY